MGQREGNEAVTETRKLTVIEIYLNLLEIEQRLRYADPTVDQDLRGLMELSAHAAGRLKRNETPPAVAPLAAGGAPAVAAAALPVAAPAGAPIGKGSE